MGLAFEWTEADVTRLKAMHAEGGSAAEMAAVLGRGLSRNAVLGKLHRLKLSRSRPPKREPAPKPEKLARPAPVERIELPREPRPARRDVPAPEGGVLFLESSQLQCAFPAAGWERASIYEKRVCGALRTGLSSYCRACEAIAYQPARQRDSVTRQVTKGIAA